MAENDHMTCYCEPQTYFMLELLRERGLLTYKDLGAFIRNLAENSSDVTVDVETGKRVGEIPPSLTEKARKDFQDMVDSPSSPLLEGLPVLSGHLPSPRVADHLSITKDETGKDRTRMKG
ncbi:hypothetical protein LCGC14_0734150 [marine sediment metagenome]|uniref:Uncharacterized protein n=1 Tax=marine sediment metagenome TaxID=412755 RepID=A0A0F9TFY6_9ZZZZ